MYRLLDVDAKKEVIYRDVAFDKKAGRLNLLTSRILYLTVGHIEHITGAHLLS